MARQCSTPTRIICGVGQTCAVNNMASGPYSLSEVFDLDIGTIVSEILGH